MAEKPNPAGAKAGSPEPSSSPPAERADGTSRRGLLKVATVAVGAASVLAAAVPGVVALAFPTRRRTVRQPEGALDAGDAKAVIADAPVKVDLVAPDSYDAWLHRKSAPVGAVYLRRGAAGKIDCWSATCPHLGCFVEWAEKDKRFECPCHGSAFDASGAKTDGPSPRGLDTLEATEENGRIKVKFARFIIGISDRVKV